jgi:hypothetical protein
MHVPVLKFSYSTWSIVAGIPSFHIVRGNLVYSLVFKGLFGLRDFQNVGTGKTRRIENYVL